MCHTDTTSLLNRCSFVLSFAPRIILPFVGDIHALSIGHNDKGPGPEWHCEMVEVRDVGP